MFVKEAFPPSPPLPLFDELQKGNKNSFVPGSTGKEVRFVLNAVSVHQRDNGVVSHLHLPPLEFLHLERGRIAFCMTADESSRSVEIN